MSVPCLFLYLTCGYVFLMHFSQANTFQSILVICPSSTYVILQYANGLMNWAGHPPALVGFNAGDGTNSFTVPTSLTSRVLELTKTGNTWNIARNTRNRGRWVFRVDRREVTMPGTWLLYN